MAQNTHMAARMFAAAPEPRLNGQLLGARLVGHGVMADVVIAATPSGLPAACEVARLLRAPMDAAAAAELFRYEETLQGDLSRARVVIVDDVMVSGAAMKAAVESARGRGAGQIVIAVSAASPRAVEAMLPLVQSVHTLSRT
ncbi:MAG: phosphoribosyltransferase [Chloroflexi bacterium]|nr:phosphoribosyltransferase [Chloroflexota bacterium]